MANSLLDFVMSVVRDPDAAAHYAADPAQAIADANLTDVTSADVNHLIPVVAESLSSAMPGTGGDGFGPADSLSSIGDGGNVWASGAATAAFDAFDDHLPLQGGDVIADHVPVVSSVIDHQDAPVISDGFDGTQLPSVATPTDPSDVASEFDVSGFEDVPFADSVPLDHQADGHQLDDHQTDAHDPGFDVFT